MPPIPIVSSLVKHMESKLSGSSLQIVQIDSGTLTLNADDEISLKVTIDVKEKKMEFALFSPKLNRTVAFEEIGESVFLDARLDDELKSNNHEAEEADISLAIDLLEKWARENKYSFSHKA